MFYTTDHKEGSINFAGAEHFQPEAATAPNFSEYPLIIPDRFHIEHALNFILCTCHPDEQEPQLIFSQISPVSSFYCINNMQEEFDHITTVSRMHRHDFYELMFVIDGCVYQNIEHQRHMYPAGSCCLMNRNTYHYEEYRSDYRVIFLQIAPHLIQDLLSPGLCFPGREKPFPDALNDFFFQEFQNTEQVEKKFVDFIPKRDTYWLKKEIHTRFEKILLELQAPQVSSDYKIRMLLTELLANIFRADCFENTPVQLGSSQEQMLFYEIRQYYMEHAGRVTRKDLTHRFHYSGDYIYKIIQKYTGLSISEYGMKLTMKEAASLLLNTGLSVCDIMQRLKFKNQTQFYQCFRKEFHMSPKEYRKNYVTNSMGEIYGK